MPVDTRNSFITAPEYMQDKQNFNEILHWCDFPETVSIMWIKLMEAWLSGGIHDSIFLHYTAWFHPDLFRATYCLIDVYSGGMV